MALTPESFIPPAVTILGSMLAVWATNVLTYDRSNREKLWELRRQGYGVILAELAAVERILESADAYIQENLHRYFEEVANDHSRRIATHMAVVHDRFASEYLIVSDEFMRLYESFQAELAATPDNDPVDDHDHFDQAVRQWRPLLLAQARSEMPLRRRWRFGRIPSLARS